MAGAGGLVVLVGMLLIALVGEGSAVRPAPSPSATPVSSADAIIAAGRASAERAYADQEAREELQLVAARAKAEKVWIAYDALPPAKKTLASVRDALAETTAAGVGLPPKRAMAFARETAIAARKRVAPAAVHGASTTGADEDGFVPTSDAAVCRTICEEAAAENGSWLCPMGFRAVVCPPERRRSQVTGKPIEIDGATCALDCSANR